MNTIFVMLFGRLNHVRRGDLALVHYSYIFSRQNSKRDNKLLNYFY